MTYQRIQKNTKQTQAPTESLFTPRPFAPIQKTTPIKNQQGQQTQGLVQRKPNLLEIPIQAKLTIGQPGNKYEQEAVIQRDEEVDAAAHTANREIRRGNRRGSIDETEYKSAATTDFMREYMGEIEGELIEILEKDERLDTVFGRQIESIIENDMYFTAILAELFKAGNCNEFAASAYTYLMRHTNQKAIYMASIVGTHNDKKLDHGVVITSPQRVSEPADLDPESAVVIDAWYNYKVLKLSQFYNGMNHYGLNIDASNIKFKQSGLSTGEGQFSQEIIAYIANAARQIYRRYKPEYDKILEEVKVDFAPEEQVEGIATFDRNGRDVDDMRTQH